ncbi:MAG: RcnB family protein [Pseudoxanthomonas sp.]
MKGLLLTTSLAATLLLSSAAAFAHDNHGNNGKHGKHGKHDQDRDGYYDRHEHKGKHDNGRHYGQVKKAYRRGDYVPMTYWEPRYYVNDYRSYRLAPPPRGYRWVRPQDDRYLLVEITTGLISQALGY